MRKFYIYNNINIKRRKIIFIAAVIIFILFIIIWLYAMARMRPLLERMAVTRASNTVNRIVTAAVNEAVENGSVSYEKLIHFEKDHDGHIAAVYTNMAVCNRLQSEILDIILSRIEEVPAKELSIPIGTLLEIPVFAGRGPRISARMESMGSSSARFENVFISAGINQTSHRIILHIDVSLAILLPGFTTATKVSNAVTVAETIIVGIVPETYTYFSTNPSDGIDEQKDYVLNKG